MSHYVERCSGIFLLTFNLTTMSVIIVLLQIVILFYNDYTARVITKNQKEINNNILYLKSQLEIFSSK